MSAAERHAKIQRAGAARLGVLFSRGILEGYDKKDLYRASVELGKLSEDQALAVLQLKKKWNPSPTLLMWYVQAPNEQTYPAIKAPSGRAAWLKHHVLDLIKHEAGPGVQEDYIDTLAPNKRQRVTTFVSAALLPSLKFAANQVVMEYLIEPTIISISAGPGAGLVKALLKLWKVHETAESFKDIKESFHNKLQENKEQLGLAFRFLPGAVSGHPMNVIEDMPLCALRADWKPRSLSAANFSGRTKYILGHGTIEEQRQALASADRPKEVRAIMDAITQRKEIVGPLREPIYSMIRPPVVFADEAIAAQIIPMVDLTPEAVRAKASARARDLRVGPLPKDRVEKAPEMRR